MRSEEENIKIAIISGYDLLRNCFITLLRGPGYCIQPGYATGKEFISNLDDSDLPHLIFIDIDKHEEEAYETISYLKANYPFINLLVLTIEADKNNIDEIRRSGANGFVVKTIDPRELKLAIKCVITKGVYYQKITRDIYNTYDLKELEAFVKKFYR